MKKLAIFILFFLPAPPVFAKPPCSGERISTIVTLNDGTQLKGHISANHYFRGKSGDRPVDVLPRHLKSVEILKYESWKDMVRRYYKTTFRITNIKGKSALVVTDSISIAFGYYDDLSMKNECKGLYASNIKQLEFDTDRVGNFKINKRTKAVYPGSFNYDPITGESLVWGRPSQR